jgi:two-component system sensor histidine kinase DegS
MELWAARKDKTEFPVDITLSPVRTDEGELVIGAVRDMTEQKRLQTELEETHRRLFESVEAERLLLSQELHDGPIQELYGVVLTTESIKDMVAGEDLQEELSSLTEAVQSVIQTLRTICGELRPPVLTQFGLEKAIRSHMLKLHEAHPEIVVKSELMNDGRKLPERAQLALYRVYQNSISNVIRHADAKNIHVRFTIEEKRAQLQIEDDGRGFVFPKKRVELVRSGHFGLVGIAERVEALNGNLTVESAPGKGTKIHVELPLTAL